jgi:hypothetical protein
MDQDELIQSIHSCLADIGRWVLMGALKGSFSADRKSDIIRSAQRILDLAQRL